MFRLDGKRALITGGGTGIGFAIADLFARQGATVALSGRRADVLERAVSKLEASHGSGCAIYLQGDVSNVESARAMVSDCISRLGGLELLVNSAGSVDRVTSLESTIEGWCVPIPRHAQWSPNNEAQSHCRLFGGSLHSPHI